MSEISEFILQLCDDAAATLQDPSGCLIYNHEIEKFRLQANDIQFHKLNYEELCAALVGLTKVLIFPRLNTLIASDHIYFWAWCAEIILSDGNYFSIQEREIRELLSTVVRALIDDSNSSYLADKRHLIASYLAFPLLEGLLKKKCSAFVDSNGQVQAPFTVTREDGSQRRYEQRNNSRCNSLGDLLYLLKYTILSNTSELYKVLDGLAKHVRSLDPSMDPLMKIYNWRNTSLHGSDSFATIGGILLNFSIALCIDDLHENFETLRSSGEQKMQFRVAQAEIISQQGTLFDSWYYPPLHTYSITSVS
jgi:hypothetical protein